jgi:Holliday junction resolvase-like predicted endonuclease
VLNENQIVERTKTFLESRNYHVSSARRTNERGIDIVASSADGRRVVFVEAKGATSSKKGTTRYGKPFSLGQCKTHLAVALYAVARLRQNAAPTDRVAIALPAAQPHQHLVDAIEASLRQLEVGVFFVPTRGRVRFWAPWRL